MFCQILKFSMLQCYFYYFAFHFSIVYPTVKSKISTVYLATLLRLLSFSYFIVAVDFIGYSSRCHLHIKSLILLFQTSQSFPNITSLREIQYNESEQLFVDSDFRSKALSLLS